MQEKSIMVVRCRLKIPSLGITGRHHKALPLVTEFSIRTSQPLKVLIISMLYIKVCIKNGSGKVSET